jgi:7,8-dihydropterin-6-yl-methyl-4-(beta-D-ribofuranosyl)aminobenzene 5'-phosphate synthase
MSHVDHDLGVSRRDVLCAGGTAMLSYLVSAMLGGAQPVRARALNGQVPEVDHLAVRVVTDSYQLAIPLAEKSAKWKSSDSACRPPENPC